MNAQNMATQASNFREDRVSDKSFELSIVVVSYNTRDLTCDCIRSIDDSKLPMRHEVIVYDNASDDGSAELIESLFPKVKVIRSDQNVGFAAANNIAVETVRGEWVLLLNPDTQVLDKGIDRLFQYAAKTNERGIFGGASITPGGAVDYRSCWARPGLWGLSMRALGISSLAKNSKVLNPEEMPDWQRDSIKEVDVITGCFLMLKKTTWDELGGFDVDYFMYSEETDLCLRAAKHGIARIFFPHARVLHIGGASERSKPYKTIKLFRGKCLYFEKNYGWLVSTSAALILNIHVLTRLLALGARRLLTNNITDEFQHWLTVWQQRKTWNKPEHHIGRDLKYTCSAVNEQLTICTVNDSISLAS
jgi:N-acetylglucosaminyl-diphospho-decaprenol L-rhamnosyltransferase